ncbi:MAG: GTPase Era [Candidatus Sumerlaeia bacterium]
MEAGHGEQVCLMPDDTQYHSDEEILLTEGDDITSPLDAPEGFRSGFVALLGEPNVGKSTLMNALLDFKLAIVSPKPQTTRDAIRGIFTDETCQIVFVDTPGVMDPQDAFNACLRDNALVELEGADVIYHLVDATEPHALPEVAREALDAIKTPLILIVNKADLLPEFAEGVDSEGFETEIDFPFSTERYERIIALSALTGRSLDRLIEETRRLLPEGDYLYDPDQITDRDMRFLSAEIVREKVLENLQQEVPYSIAVQTEEFKEHPGSKHMIRVNIYVEHDSQKSIVIGKGGSMLKKIGSEARHEIEEMADHPVFLELWVKVRKKWRKKENALREFGYRIPKNQK